MAVNTIDKLQFLSFFNVDFSVYSDISEAETLEMAVANAVLCLVSDIMFILEC